MKEATSRGRVREGESVCARTDLVFVIEFAVLEPQALCGVEAAVRLPLVFVLRLPKRVVCV